jgi:hypothetical protein
MARDLYTYDASLIPDGVTINKLTLVERIAGSHPDAAFGFVIKISGTEYNSAQVVGGYYHWTNLSLDYPLNLKTGLPWTKADVAALQAGPFINGVHEDGIDNPSYLDQFYIIVDFTFPDVEGQPVRGEIAEVTPVAGSVVASGAVAGALTSHEVSGTAAELLSVSGGVRDVAQVVGDIIADDPPADTVEGFLVEDLQVTGSLGEAHVTGAIDWSHALTGAISGSSIAAGSISEETPVHGHLQEHDVA